MTKDDEFRRNAAECLRIADATANAHERAQWLDMAAFWRRRIGKKSDAPTNDVPRE